MRNLQSIIRVGGPLRTTGVKRIVEYCLADPSLLEQLWPLLQVTHDAGIRSRSINAIEKICRQRPDLIQPKQSYLYDLYMQGEAQQEVLWNLTLTLAHLSVPLEAAELMVPKLMFQLKSTSRISVVTAMECLAYLTIQHPVFKPEVVPMIWRFSESSIPSIFSRAKKLMKKIAVT